LKILIKTVPTSLGSVTNLKADLTEGTRGARVAGRKVRGASALRKMGASTSTGTTMLREGLTASILGGLRCFGSKIGVRGRDIKTGESLLVNA
jgi:hypothetical protein